MQKIISLFQRNYDGDHLVRDEIVPGAEWVVAGEGVATRKYDGTCCMVRGGKLFKRYDCKRGKTPPPGFEAAMEPDPVTGHHCGWLPVSADDPTDKWHREAFAEHKLGDGAFELCGPNVQGNPERLTYHKLIRHGSWILPEAPRAFDDLKLYFQRQRAYDIEGIVWHHSDGRMVKIKGKDFGIKRSSP